MYLVLGVVCQGGVCPGGCVCQGGGVCPGTPPLWTEFLTHASENITLPQTSFAGGKKIYFILVQDQLQKVNFFVTDTRVFFISKIRPVVFQDKPYSMTNPHLGFTVIVNNVAFEISDSVEDQDVLSRSLQTMGYTTKSYSDCNVQVRQPSRTLTVMYRWDNQVVQWLQCPGEDNQVVHWL